MRPTPLSRPFRSQVCGKAAAKPPPSTARRVVSATEAAVIATRRLRSASEIVSGGISTITSPSGRITAPRRRAAMATACPSRSPGGPADQLDAHHESSLAHFHHPRQHGDALRQQPLEEFDLWYECLQCALAFEGLKRRYPSGTGKRITRVVWPWKKVRASSGAPRNPS